jgi:Ca-activated chloride channel family protein
VLLIFSDGEDNSSAWDMMDAIEQAQAEDVRVYALRYTEKRRGRLMARSKYGIRVMDRIARETGGANYDASEGDLRKWFREIGEELRASYELAYHSTNPNRDGTFRKVVIRAKTPGLTVRAKTGYYARQ